MEGRAVVVTGAFGALGRVVVEAAAARGALTAAIGAAAAPPADVAKRLPASTLVIPRRRPDRRPTRRARRWRRSKPGSAGSTR